MKKNTISIGLIMITSILIFGGVLAADNRQASAAPGGLITGDGKGSLGCPDGTHQPASISFSGNDNGKTVSGTLRIALSDGTATGTGDITKGQVSKNHYALQGNWNRGGLCGLTDSHSFSVSGAPGPSVLMQYVDICQECKHDFSGTVTITPIK
jgi:hypothetical protein